MKPCLRSIPFRLATSICWLAALAPSLAVAAPPEAVLLLTSNAEELDAQGQVTSTPAAIQAGVTFASPEPGASAAFDSAQTSRRALVREDSRNLAFMREFSSLDSLRAFFPPAIYTFAVESDAARTFQIDHTQPFELEGPAAANLAELNPVSDPANTRIEWTYGNDGFLENDAILVIVLDEAGELVIQRELLASPAVRSLTVSLQPDRRYTGTVTLARFLEVELRSNGDTALISGHSASQAFPIDTTAALALPVLSGGGLRVERAVGGKDVVLEVQVENADQAKPFEVQWLKDGQPVPGASALSLALPADAEEGSGLYRAEVENAAGSVQSGPFEVEIFPAEAPVVVRDPASVAAAHSENVALGVVARGRPEPTYQWLKDGQPIPGATRPNLEFAMAEAAQGAYRVEVANQAGSALSAAAEVAPGPARQAPPARMVNLSTRAKVGSGDRQVIAGFVVQGSQPLRLLLRGLGPALLEQSDSLDVLANPRVQLLETFTGGKPPESLTANDDWTARPDLAQISQRSLALGAPELDLKEGRDAALYATLEPGLYTVIAGGGEGVGLVEVFEDTEFPSDSRLVNLSTRAYVGKGDEVAIGGFVVAGDRPRSYLLRGAGPDLAARGVKGFLPDPAIRIFDASGVALAENDDWDPALAAIFAALGADPFDEGSRDAALRVELEPGVYTVHLRSADERTGIGLVEIFEVLE